LSDSLIDFGDIVSAHPLARDSKNVDLGFLVKLHDLLTPNEIFEKREARFTSGVGIQHKL
jgi:hypothetical protein